MKGEPGFGSWRWLYFRKEFHDKIRTGVKTHTLRNQRLPPGTRVACPVGLLEIVAVSKTTALWVGQNRWREEGCTSKEAFFETFQRIYPEPEALGVPMWLHVFRLEVPA